MRNWQAYHNFEEKEKTFFLRKMSRKDSVNMLRQFYKFADGLKGKSHFTGIDKAKIKHLARVHAMFNKVKE